MKNMQCIIIFLSMFLCAIQKIYGVNLKTKIKDIPSMMNDYRSYRDPELFKNTVEDYKQAAAYVEITNLKHELELQDLNARLDRLNRDVFVYKTATQCIAPALAVTIGFHTFLHKRQQQSQSCINAAVGISLGASLLWMARSHFKVGDK